MCVQNVFPIGFVEPLDNGILLWFSFLDFDPFNIILMQPLLEQIRGEFRAVIGADAPGFAMLLHNTLQKCYYRSGGHRGADIYSQTFSVILINNIQSSEP